MRHTSYLVTPLGGDHRGAGSNEQHDDIMMHRKSNPATVIANSMIWALPFSYAVRITHVARNKHISYTI